MAVKQHQKHSVSNADSITVFSENLFDKVIQNVSHPQYQTINSHFTDEQAKSICSKMSNKRIRHFANLFLTETSSINTDILRFQLHYLSKKALLFYGGRILTFIYKLQNWPMRVANVELLKMNPNVIYDFDTNFPKVEMKSYEQDKEFLIRFTRAYERPLGSYPALRITNAWTGRTSNVSVNGMLIDDFENCIPEVAIFREIVEGQFFLYSGYDDDFCDICGRRLEDPISIKYGRGPTCRNNHGTP